MGGRIALVLVAVGLISLTACQGEGTNSSAAAPRRVCGKVLFASAGGLQVQDVSEKSSTVAPSSNYVLYRLTPTCIGSGKLLTLRPSECADVDNAVTDSQGRVIAVALLTHDQGCRTFRLLLDGAPRLKVR